MTAADSSLLFATLREVTVLAGASPAQWEAVVRAAREANVLGRIAAALDEAGLLEAVPREPRAHLDAVATIARAQARSARYEIDELRAALAPLDVPVTLLKGAAYLMAEMPVARGRLFSDIDILVPRPALPRVEAALMLAGWATTHHDPYDQRYYREWMHELPPMQHVHRRTVLDVHHTILPLTGRLAPDAAKLVASSRALATVPPLRVLAPHDLVLHAAVHLFQDEDLGHGLRDLCDLDGLLRSFSPVAGFWTGLVERARELDLARPLHYALRSAVRLLGTPVPAAAREAVASAAPPAPVASIMDLLLERAMRPRLTGASTRWSRRLLYVRGHWLKMPPHLLAWHLAHKALRPKEDEVAAP